MRDLTQHLTTRADDSHAAPVCRSPKGRSPSPDTVLPCQGLVRFCALLRIKPHAPPLVRAPVNSFEFQPCGRTPQAVRLSRWLRHRGPRAPDTQRASFTAWTTRVSNPVCSPRCRASASEMDQAAAFATGVLPNIYEFHLYTGNSTTLFHPQAPPYQAQSPG